MKFLVALFVILSAVALSSATDCKFGSYDFSPLANGTVYSMESGEFMYYWAYCASATGKCGTTAPVPAACQVKPKATPVSITTIGVLSTKKFTEIPNGVNLIYNATSNPCKSGAFRSSTIHMICGKNDMSVTAVSEPVPCQYEIDVTTCHACKGGCGGSTPSGDGGKKGGMGGGWIFVIILVVCSVVYIAGGAIFNFKVKGLRGAEVFPNSAFWKDLPGLMKDGIFFVKSKVTGSGGSGGYQQV
eukprot:gene11626-13573_t